MQHQKFESGRTLLETISVIVLMAVLALGGITGYDFVIKKYREKETAKRISELVTRYKLRPVKSEEKLVQLKQVYPEVEKADAVTMKTPDTQMGRVQLQLFEETSSFSVVVNQILDTSCREIIENSAYDMLVAGDQIDADKAANPNAYSRDYLLNDPEGQEIAAKLCQSSEAHHIGTVGLVLGDECPSTGASYWYAGKCWNCSSDRAQDIYGNCCAKDAIDACGLCPGKCPNGGVCNADTKSCVECTTDEHCAGRTDGKLKCDTSVNKCVECLNPGERCTGEPEKYCMKNHTCQECDTTKHLFWNRELDICDCVKPLIAAGEACFDGCCAEGTTCHEGICTGCWLDYDEAEPGKEGSCPAERPLCNNGSCEGCPAKPTTEGAACFELCGCDTAKGLACAEGTCTCSLDPVHSVWVPAKALCCPSESNYEQLCDAETGATCCSTGFCTEAGSDGTRLCCHTGEVNSMGHCCPSGKEWKDGEVGVCCQADEINSMGHCCPAGKEWKDGEVGACCLANEVNVDGHCCSADKPFWDSSKNQCVECAVSPDCPENEACVSNRCVPCNTSKTGVRAKNEEHCSCPEGFTKKCGSTKTTGSCVDGGNWICTQGCFDNTDCDTDEKCSCSGRSCPAAGGQCEPCPEGTHRRADSSDQCQACSECEEWDETKGECVSLCAADEICMQKGGSNKNPLMCGGYFCQKMPKKTALLVLIGTINKREYYIPPSGAAYRMTHKAADSFCHYYGMHLPTVIEACLKDFKYDSGHDCPNIVGVKQWTDKNGNKVDLTKYNTSTSGDFWLANLDKNGEYALRVTHSCGNNHETHVCEKVYPLCATN